MCGRIFCLFENSKELVEEVINELDRKIDDSEFMYSSPNYNIPPSTFIPVLDSSYHLKNLKWGFKSGKINCVNARCEVAETTLSYKYLINSQRCVVICNGYFEWHNDPRTKKKIPYSFNPESSQLCFIAGLRDSRSNSVVLMTRDAAPSIQHIHSRMPVLLHKENVLKWLDHRFNFVQLRKSLIDEETYRSYIKATALASHVNKVENNGPKCLQSLENYNEQLDRHGICKYFKKLPKKPRISE